VKYSFYFGGVVFLGAVLWTVISTKEYSPEELARFTELDIVTRSKIGTDTVLSVPTHRFFRDGMIWLFVGLLGSAILHFYLQQTDYGLYVLFIGSIVFGFLQLIVAFLTQRGKTHGGTVAVFNDFYNMPKTMKQLALVQFFSWFALFAMWIYTTPAVTHHIYGATDPTSELYNRGADWVGVLMAVYNGFAAVMAFVLVWLANKTNRKTVHMISLFCGGLALFSFYVIKNPTFLLVSELGIGLAWASILAMPYAILAGSLPAQKMGVYMGIFNFFIVIPQITAAAILGWYVKHWFGGNAIYALLLGGASMIIAGLLVLRVKDVDEIAVRKK
jgi:maltose/moltooligosaccharide transporter